MVACAVQVTAGTTSRTDRCQPCAANSANRGANDKSFSVSPDRVNQDERLQFHLSVVRS